MAHNEAISPVVDAAVLEALFRDAAVLEALFRQSLTDLLILDTELRILRINLTRPLLRSALRTGHGSTSHRRIRPFRTR